MRIATWNLNKPTVNSVRRGAIQQRIEKTDADVWVLTETDTKFSPGKGYQLIAHSSRHANDLEVERRQNANAVWTTIWSRLPAQRIVTIADPDRTAAAWILPEDDAPLLVYGTVLPWLSDNRINNLHGAIAFVHALEVQAAEWTSLIGILRKQHSTTRLCVAGDFNQAWTDIHFGSTVGNEALQRAMDHPNQRLVCVTGENDPLIKSTTHRTIDHICVSAPIAGCKVGIWPESDDRLNGLSDHYGLWLDLPQKNS
jgi:endonuclease/exonuclease/phosphatase family metal-dependent hydrolase